MYTVHQRLRTSPVGSLHASRMVHSRQRSHAITCAGISYTRVLSRHCQGVGVLTGLAANLWLCRAGYATVPCSQYFTQTQSVLGCSTRASQWAECCEQRLALQRKVGTETGHHAHHAHRRIPGSRKRCRGIAHPTATTSQAGYPPHRPGTHLKRRVPTSWAGHRLCR